MLDQFSRVLEEIGLAAWHGDGRTTTVREIEEHCKASGLASMFDAFEEGAKALRLVVGQRRDNLIFLGPLRD